MGGYVIVSEIGSQITFIRDNLPIKKSDLLLNKGQYGWKNQPSTAQ